MVAGWMVEVKKEGRVDLGQTLTKAKEDWSAPPKSPRMMRCVDAILQGYWADGFADCSADSKVLIEGWGRVWAVVVDPHTAVGLAVTERVIKTA